MVATVRFKGKIAKIFKIFKFDQTISSLTADSFNIINIHPNYLVTFENESEAMEFSDCDSHQVIFKVERCRKLVNDEMDDDAM